MGAATSEREKRGDGTERGEAGFEEAKGRAPRLKRVPASRRRGNNGASVTWCLERRRGAEEGDALRQGRPGAGVLNPPARWRALRRRGP